MLKNYFKIALKVMMRKKFFSFISLFGISFTLMILMVVTAFLDIELGSHAPLTQQDKMVFLDRLELKLMIPDTNRIIDSTRNDGIVTLDTSYSYSERQRSMSASSLGYYYLNKYMSDIEAAEDYCIYSDRHTVDVFINSNKLTLSSSYVSASFWNIFDFQLVEGNFFGRTAIDNQEKVAVITQKTAKEYFGVDQGITGQEMILDDQHIKVVGIVKTPPSNQLFLSSGLFLPLTNINPRWLTSDDFLGGFRAAYLAASSAKRQAIKDEIKKKTAMVQLPNPEQYNRVNVITANFLENYAENLLNEGDPAKSSSIFLYSLGGLLLLFFILPTLNLVNINVSRILERSSEIGLRKAFGANANDILYQFVFENILLTFVGGIIGFLLALLLFFVINSSQVLPETILSFNYQVFFYSFLICLFFGILSGLIPAYKMSKIHIVNALKQNSNG
ncbi:MAG: ABC transporter permease [Saprospiraceae bacterium]